MSEGGVGQENGMGRVGEGGEGGVKQEGGVGLGRVSGVGKYVVVQVSMLWWGRLGGVGQAGGKVCRVDQQESGEGRQGGVGGKERVGEVR